MMDKKRFKQNMLLFCENYNFEISESYLKLVFGHLDNNNITDECFENGVNNIISTKKKTDFYGRPAVADWLDMLGILNKPLTLENVHKIRASEIMGFLANQSYVSQYGIEVWDYADYNKLFDDESINVLIEAEFGSVRGLIDRYKEQKKSGYVELFRKELQEMFEVQDLASQKNKIAIGYDKKEGVGKIVHDLSKQLTEG